MSNISSDDLFSDPSYLASFNLPFLSEPITVTQPSPYSITITARPPVTKTETKTETDDSIVCQQQNPKRRTHVQTASSKRYDAYKHATTKAEFFAAGGTHADFAWDVEKGHITGPAADSFMEKLNEKRERRERRKRQKTK